MKDNLEKISPRLRLLRKLMGISQREFAARIGVSLSHYSKLESGIGGISDALILTIAAETACDLRWLRNGAGSAPEDSYAFMKIKSQDSLSSAQIEHIINFIEQESIQELAAEIAANADIPYNRVLSILAKEALAVAASKE